MVFSCIYIDNCTQFLPFVKPKTFGNLFQMLNKICRYGPYSDKYWNNPNRFAFLTSVAHGTYFTGSRCLLFMNHISLSFDSSLCWIGTGYGVISPHRLLSVSEWDWVALTSLGDFPVILMVISSICLSFRDFLGDCMEPTVISFPSFPQSCAVCPDKTC